VVVFLSSAWTSLSSEIKGWRPQGFCFWFLLAKDAVTLVAPVLRMEEEEGFLLVKDSVTAVAAVLSIRALWIFYFSTKNYEPSGIWALDYMLTGEIIFFMIRLFFDLPQIDQKLTRPAFRPKTNILKYMGYCIQNDRLSRTVSTKQ
jgi:hypothetical protein